MSRAQKQALADLGIEVVKIRPYDPREGDTIVWPPTWGIELRKDEQTLCVVESTGGNDDTHDTKQYLRDSRAPYATHPREGAYASARTQRECLSWYFKQLRSLA